MGEPLKTTVAKAVDALAAAVAEAHEKTGAMCSISIKMTRDSLDPRIRTSTGRGFKLDVRTFYEMAVTVEAPHD